MRLGQRTGLSEKDIRKINAMYRADCNNDTINIVDMHVQMQQQQQEVFTISAQENFFDAIFKWFENIFSLNL